MRCETYEHTDKTGQRWIFALSDVWTEAGKVEAVDLRVYRNDDLVAALEFPGTQAAALERAWRFIEKRYLAQ